MLKHGFRQMFLGMEQVSSLSRLLNLHRLLQQKESNQLKKENKMKKSFCISWCMFLCVVGDADSLHAACTYLTGKWVQDHDREKRKSPSH